MKNTTVKLFALTLTAGLALTALTACSGAGGSAALPSATPDADGNTPPEGIPIVNPSEPAN